MGTSLIRAMLLASAGIAVAVVGAPTAAYAQEATYQIDIPAQSMGDALRALGKATKQNIVFSGSVVKGKRSAGVRGRMSASDALAQMLAGSGLKMGRGSGGGFTVVQGGNGGAGSAQAQGKSIVTGEVSDYETGRRLQGVVIRIEGTGISTVTDEQGRYRIAGVPEGVVKVQASFLGFVQQTQDVIVSSNTARVVDFSLGTTDEIVVYGSTSARALALNQERAADNAQTVVSSDLLGQFNGTTISDALRRAPGVAFVRDPNTGDGTNIIIRGLPSEYNQVQINGVQLPVGSAVNRDPSLNNLLAGSISKVTINKTLMPNQDSAGTGGFIEIETKSPLDRPRRFFSAGVEGVKRGKGFGEDYLQSVTASAKFGANENFGLSASYQRRVQDVTRAGYDMTEVPAVRPTFLPLDVDGRPVTSLDNIDPRRPFPFDSQADGFYPGSVVSTIGHSDITTDTLSFGAEWNPFAGTNWRVDYINSVKDDRLERTSTTMGLFSFYAPAPVPGLGGETRYVAQSFFASRGLSFINTRQKDTTDSLSFRGSSDTGAWHLEYSAGYSRAKADRVNQDLVTFGSNAALLGISFDASMALPDAADPATGIVTSFYGRQRGRAFPTPLLTQAGLDYFNSPEGITFSSANRTPYEGRSEIVTGKFSVRRDFADSALKFLEFGVDYNGNTSRSQDTTGGTLYSGIFDPDLPYFRPTAADLGIEFDTLSFDSLFGSASGFKIPSTSSLRAFLDRLPELAADGTQVEGFPGTKQPPARTKEDELAAYVQAKLQFGDFDIVGGVRFSRVSVKSTFQNQAVIVDESGFPDEPFYLANLVEISGKATQTNWLPRFLVNYRPSENFVARAGYFSTTARPRLDQITRVQSILLDFGPYYGPQFNQPQLTVSKGNPDLKPTTTHNFDLSLERYFPSVGVIKLGAYFKLFKNLAESAEFRGGDALEGIDLPDDPRFQNLPANIIISTTIPYSNPRVAKAWGVEASVERQLDFISPALKGLSVYLNYTYSDSSKTQPLTWFGSPILDAQGNVIGRQREDILVKGVRFDGQPPHSGTAGLMYSRFGVDASIYYTYQSRRRTVFNNFNLHGYDEASDSFDARIQYTTSLGGATARLFLSGNDLLKSAKDANNYRSVGGAGATPKYYIGAGYLGGRTVTGGISIDF